MKFGKTGGGYSRRIAAALLLCGLAGLLSGCGGGGGGNNNNNNGGNAIITGQVLLVSTNAPPVSPAVATVSSGGMSATASATDGTFTLSNVPTSTNALTVSVTQTSGVPLVRTLPIALTVNETASLGTIYVGGTGYNAVVTGRVVTQGTAGIQGVGNATVTIAGVQVRTSADAGTLGQFTVSGLPTGLGSELGVLLGTVQATGFATYQLVTNTSNLNFPTGLASGANNNIGDITILQPSGSTPAPPYTITGQITVAGVGQANQSVNLTQNGTLVGSVTSGANGSYFFWVVPGTYTVQATRSQNGQSQSASVTLVTPDTPVTAPTINFAQ